MDDRFALISDQQWQPPVHDDQEEALLIAGDVCGVAGGATSGADAGFACAHRPPGTPHGPIAATGGCILLEVQYDT